MYVHQNFWLPNFCRLGLSLLLSIWISNDFSHFLQEITENKMRLTDPTKFNDINHVQIVEILKHKRLASFLGPSALLSEQTIFLISFWDLASLLSLCPFSFSHFQSFSQFYLYTLAISSLPIFSGYWFV